MPLIKLQCCQNIRLSESVLRSLQHPRSACLSALCGLQIYLHLPDTWHQ